jgi:hypothetical protein
VEQARGSVAGSTLGANNEPNNTHKENQLMSGRKYSQYALEESIHEALRCGIDARDLAVHADGRIQALDELTEQVPAARAVTASVRPVVGEIRQRLAAIEGELNVREATRMSLGRVQDLRREITDLGRRLEEVTARTGAGQDIATRRIELAVLLHQIISQEGDLRDWATDDYDRLRQHVEALVIQADAALESGVSSAGVTEVRQLAGQLASLRELVSSKRLQDQERRYVLEALVKVCQSLGFKLSVVPSQLPTDDLVAEVDTYSHGVIQFRLQLDGYLRSESSIVPLACDVRFSALEEKLRGLGVITAFQYEADQRPVRLQRGSKSLPETGAARSAQKESR